MIYLNEHYKDFIDKRISFKELLSILKKSAQKERVMYYVGELLKLENCLFENHKNDLISLFLNCSTYVSNDNWKHIFLLNYLTKKEKFQLIHELIFNNQLNRSHISSPKHFSNIVGEKLLFNYLSFGVNIVLKQQPINFSLLHNYIKLTINNIEIEKKYWEKFYKKIQPKINTEQFSKTNIRKLSILDSDIYEILCDMSKVINLCPHDEFIKNRFEFVLLFTSKLEDKLFFSMKKTGTELGDALNYFIETLTDGSLELDAFTKEQLNSYTIMKKLSGE